MKDKKLKLRSKIKAIYACFLSNKMARQLRPAGVVGWLADAVASECQGWLHLILRKLRDWDPSNLANKASFLKKKTSPFQKIRKRPSLRAKVQHTEKEHFINIHIKTSVYPNVKELENKHHVNDDR